MFYVTRQSTRKGRKQATSSSPAGRSLPTPYTHGGQPSSPAAITFQHGRRDGDCTSCSLRRHGLITILAAPIAFGDLSIIVPLRSGPQEYRSFGAVAQRLGLDFFALP